jgi:hypothetical protein
VTVLTAGSSSFDLVVVVSFVVDSLLLVVDNLVAVSFCVVDSLLWAFVLEATVLFDVDSVVVSFGVGDSVLHCFVHHGGDASKSRCMEVAAHWDFPTVVGVKAGTVLFLSGGPRDSRYL